MTREKETRYILSAEDRSRIAFESVQRSFEKLDALAGKVGLSLGAAFSIRGLAEFVSHSIEAADQTGKLAQKLGISTESLSAYKFAADLSNVSQDELTKGLGKLSNTMLSAATGNQKNSGILKTLGVDMDSLRGGTLTLDQAFVQITKRVAGMQDGWQKTSLLQAAFGKSAKDLIPLMNDNADGFRAVTEEATKLGVIISSDLAAAAAQLNDNMTRLHARMRAVGLTAAQDLLPTLNDVAEAFLKMTSDKDSTTGFWKSVGELMRIAAVAAGSFWLALKDMGDGIGALMAQTAALAHFDLDAVKTIGAERDAQYAKNKKQFEDFQASLLQHSILFGDGTPGSPEPRKRGASAVDLSELETEKSNLRKLLESIEAETAKIDMGPIGEKWVKIFQAAEESGVSAAAAAQRATPVILGLVDAMSLAREEAERGRDRLKGWESAFSFKQNIGDEVAALSLRNAMIGQGAFEISKATRLQQFDNQVRNDSAHMSEDQAQAFAQVADVLRGQLADALNENYKLSRRATAGFAEGLAQVWDASTDYATHARDFTVNAFRTMEDALVQFTKTGKLDFKSLADSIITDLIRIRIQQSVTGPLAAALSGNEGTMAAAFNFLTGGGSAASVGSTSYGPVSSGGVPGRASGGDIAANQPYWVGEQGPELVVPRSSGTVIPNGAGGATINVNPTIHIDSRTDQAQIMGLVQRGIAESVAQVEQSFTRGGRLAKLVGTAKG